MGVQYGDERNEGEAGETVSDESSPREDSPRAPGRFDFERGLMVVAVVLLVAAATLLYFKLPNAAFVVAALGLSAWFLNVRNGLKRKHDLVKRGGRNWEPRGRGDD